MYGALAIRRRVDPSSVERYKNQRSVNIPYQNVNISAAGYRFKFRNLANCRGDNLTQDL